jgi:hypothetical protein
MELIRAAESGICEDAGAAHGPRLLGISLN